MSDGELSLFAFRMVIAVAGLVCIGVALMLACRWIEDKINESNDWRND